MADAVRKRRGSRPPTLTARRQQELALAAEERRLADERKRFQRDLVAVPELRSFFEEIRDWDRVRIERFGEVRPDRFVEMLAVEAPQASPRAAPRASPRAAPRVAPSAAPASGLDSSWSNLPTDALTIVLKYCLTDAVHHKMVEYTNGRMYGGLLEGGSVSFLTPCLSEVEDAEIERLKASFDAGEAEGLAFAEAETAAAKHRRRMLRQHHAAFADVKRATVDEGEEGEEAEAGEEGEEGEEGGPRQVFSTTIADRKHGRVTARLSSDGKWKLNWHTFDERTSFSGSELPSHDDRQRVEAAAKRRMSREDRRRASHAEQRYQECLAIERSWAADAWAPLHVLRTCKSWRSAVLTTCPHLLAYPLLLQVYGHAKTTDELARLNSAPAAARSCVHNVGFWPTYGDTEDGTERAPVELAACDEDAFDMVADAALCVQRLLLFPRVGELTLHGRLPRYLLWAMGGRLRNGLGPRGSRWTAPMPALCSNVRALTLTHTTVQPFPEFLRMANPFCYALEGFPRLEEIRLDRAYWVDSQVLKALGLFCPNLEAISLERAYRITPSGVVDLFAGCSKLSSFSATRIDLGVFLRGSGEARSRAARPRRDGV